MGNPSKGRQICFATTALLQLALVAPMTGIARDEQVRELLVSAAVTPDEHLAAAEFYDAKARDARVEAARHREMGERYADGIMGDRKTQKEHCDRIAELHQEMAEEYEALARIHRAEFDDQNQNSALQGR